MFSLPCDLLCLVSLLRNSSAAFGHFLLFSAISVSSCFPEVGLRRDVVHQAADQREPSLLDIGVMDHTQGFDFRVACNFVVTEHDQFRQIGRGHLLQTGPYLRADQDDGRPADSGQMT